MTKRVTLIYVWDLVILQHKITSAQICLYTFFTASTNKLFFHLNFTQMAVSFMIFAFCACIKHCLFCIIVMGWYNVWIEITMPLWWNCVCQWVIFIRDGVECWCSCSKKVHKKKNQMMRTQIVHFTQNSSISIVYFFNFYDNNISVRNFVLCWKYVESCAFVQSSDNKGEVDIFIQCVFDSFAFMVLDKIDWSCFCTKCITSIDLKQMRVESMKLPDLLLSTVCQLTHNKWILFFFQNRNLLQLFVWQVCLFVLYMQHNNTFVVSKYIVHCILSNTVEND